MLAHQAALTPGRRPITLPSKLSWTSPRSSLCRACRVIGMAAYGDTVKRGSVDHCMFLLRCPSQFFMHAPHSLSPDAPVILVESATDDSVADFGPSTSDTSQKVLTTKWHEYSNADIDSALSSFGSIEAGYSDQPLHETIRTLSSAVHRLSAARAELEESRRALLQKEASRRARADQLMKELPPSDRELARRVIQSIFPDDDEDGHSVRRKFSASVSL